MTVVLVIAGEQMVEVGSAICRQSVAVILL
jgi:hypothetical protein